MKTLLGHGLAKLRQDGLATTLRAATGWVGRRLRGMARSDFDSTTGLETDGFVAAWEVQLVSQDAVPGVHYQPTSADRARAMIRALPVDLARFTFVDLGCGKGRVLFVAAEFPFRRIVGVEYGVELARIAESNVSKARLGDRIQILCQDASVFEIPDDAVVFMYNPFGPTVMARVAGSLERAHDVHVIYFEPDQACLAHLEAVANVTKVGDDVAYLHRA